VPSDPAPIHVTSCRTVAEAFGRHRAVQQTIQVTFSNAGNVAADVARFTLIDGQGKLRDFTARGAFSEGVIIADRIVPMESVAQQQLFSKEKMTGCQVTYVHFVDGSSWTAPSP
jgi:hypothetical protein